MKNNLLKNWKTTLAGIIAISLIVLNSTGVVTPTEQTELNNASNEILTHVDGIIAAVLSIALIFSKDADKE